MATLDLSNSVVADGDYTIETANTPQDQAIVTANVVSSTTFARCTGIIYSVTMIDGAALPTAFSFNTGTNTLTVQTSDAADADTYDLLLTAQYYHSSADYIVGGTQAFQYVLCDVVSLTASTLTDAEYTIG